MAKEILEAFMGIAQFNGSMTEDAKAFFESTENVKGILEASDNVGIVTSREHSDEANVPASALLIDEIMKETLALHRHEPSQSAQILAALASFGTEVSNMHNETESGKEIGKLLLNKIGNLIPNTSEPHISSTSVQAKEERIRALEMQKIELREAMSGSDVTEAKKTEYQVQLTVAEAELQLTTQQVTAGRLQLINQHVADFQLECADEFQGSTNHTLTSAITTKLNKAKNIIMHRTTSHAITVTIGALALAGAAVGSAGAVPAALAAIGIVAATAKTVYGAHLDATELGKFTKLDYNLKLLMETQFLKEREAKLLEKIGVSVPAATQQIQAFLAELDGSNTTSAAVQTPISSAENIASSPLVAQALELSTPALGIAASALATDPFGIARNSAEFLLILAGGQLEARNKAHEKAALNNLIDKMLTSLGVSKDQIEEMQIKQMIRIKMLEKLAELPSITKENIRTTYEQASTEVGNVAASSHHIEDKTHLARMFDALNPTKASAGEQQEHANKLRQVLECEFTELGKVSRTDTALSVVMRGHIQHLERAASQKLSTIPQANLFRSASQHIPEDLQHPDSLSAAKAQLLHMAAKPQAVALPITEALPNTDSGPNTVSIPSKTTQHPVEPQPYGDDTSNLIPVKNGQGLLTRVVRAVHDVLGSSSVHPTPQQGEELNRK